MKNKVEQAKIAILQYIDKSESQPVKRQSLLELCKPFASSKIVKQAIKELLKEKTIRPGNKKYNAYFKTVKNPAPAPSKFEQAAQCILEKLKNVFPNTVQSKEIVAACKSICSYNTVYKVIQHLNAANQISVGGARKNILRFNGQTTPKYTNGTRVPENENPLQSLGDKSLPPTEPWNRGLIKSVANATAKAVEPLQTELEQLQQICTNDEKKLADAKLLVQSLEEKVTVNKQLQSQLITSITVLKNNSERPLNTWSVDPPTTEQSTTGQNSQTKTN